MAIKSILLDTNAYAAFKRNQNEAFSIIANVDIIVINSIILGELLGGFALGNKLELNRYELEKFMESPRVKIFTIDEKNIRILCSHLFSIAKERKTYTC
jgi:predicted nucleic acid-binding protein